MSMLWIKPLPDQNDNAEPSQEKEIEIEIRKDAIDALYQPELPRTCLPFSGISATHKCKT
jgi:hypothetical protein